MSWHFSRALVEEYSQATCSDGKLFAPLKSMDTPEAYCWRDKMTESLNLFQYGMTLQPSTENLGVELFTWFREDSRVLTSASPVQCGDARDSRDKKAGFGLNTCGSSMKFSPCSFGGKTPQNLKTLDFQKSFERWPGAGIFVDGQLLELTTADFPTQENAYGFSLPTPTSRDWKDTIGMTLTRKDGKTRTDRLPMLLFSCVRSADIKCKQMTNTDARTVWAKGLKVIIAGCQYSPDLPEWLMGWPIGWTDCEPLAMDRFQSWQLQYGII
jgi:hypothetical protein